MVLHQIQMILLLLMIDSFIPETLKNYLSSNGFLMLNFNFIPVIDLPFIDIPVDWMDEEQVNDSLEALGIESGSSFVNNFSFFTMIVFWISVHLLLRYILICGSKIDEENQSKLARFWNKLRLKIIEIIKYTMYLRLFIEAHESMLLSATSEIYSLDFSDLGHISSFMVALLVFTISLILPTLSFYFYWVHRNDYDPDAKFFFMEFFLDLRNADLARLYTTIMLTRRIIFVTLIILFQFFPREYTYMILIGNCYSF